MKFTLLSAIIVASFLTVGSRAADSLTPYLSEAEVPDNVPGLWNGIDFQKDALDTEVVKEWGEDGVVCRYVIFTVGTFKGEASRIAAFYTFPEGAEKVPAVVWSHGGGQRAELEHGLYFARHGYAMVDINWGGREMLEGVEKNTDWGAVDPSQGPRFYPGAKREHVKLNLLPDEFTIDPVVSPRNGNWFLLAYAGRRAITFLEQQPEVDPDRIGFTGFSMGGNITSYVSIDPRLKAVVPMVGGAGFITADSPGVPNSGMGRAYHDHAELFARTMESQSYYPHTQCPVLLLNASDDFHARFEFVYQCMEVLPHDNWRVSQTMHLSHNLGPETWILMNRWFKKYLKGEKIPIPKTAAGNLVVAPNGETATFSVTPDQGDRLESLDIYYSHDPNPRSRFWIHADSIEKDGVWTAELPVRESLPLYAFANCRYPLGGTAEAFQGTTDHFTITSNQGVHLPVEIKAERLFEEAEPQKVFSDLEKDGLRDWGTGSRSGIHTYKFRDPRAATPSPDAVMKLYVTVPRERLSYRFRVSKNNYITGSTGPRSTFFATRQMNDPGAHEIVLKVSDFVDQKKNVMSDWENISTFSFEIYDGEAKESLYFSETENAEIMKRIEWVTEASTKPSAEAQDETLPPLVDGKVPQTVEELWAGFDPRAEPLDVEVLKEWEEDGVVMKVVRYRVGVFKGEKAMMAAVWGYPKGAKGLPGLVQIHGGGQYADYKAVLTNAKRGYSTISISWAGRISAPDYHVNPNVVQLFWDGKKDDPNYKVTTDWGAVDGYHAPGRNPRNQFPAIPTGDWTVDGIKSPRNNSWFLCTKGARRALTFLEQQPQVDPEKLGVYGHSMGGKLTVMTTGSDDRVKASAPSCGGISDRYNADPMFAATLHDDVYLKRIKCPIVFLSPANDFHGRINDLQQAVTEINTDTWCVTCSPHHNHQDTASYEVATQLWFDFILKGTFEMPPTPNSILKLDGPDGVPQMSVIPGQPERVRSVDVYYTQHGEPGGPGDMENTKSRFWHHTATKRDGDRWNAKIPLLSVERPLWVYANVHYALDEPVTGAGYYYGTYTADEFNLSTRMAMLTAENLQASGVKATLQASTLIESFEGDWKKEWFSYKPDQWPIQTHKVYSPGWAAPENARLVVDVQSTQANTFVVGLDTFAAGVELKGGEDWQTIRLNPTDFENAGGELMESWSNIKQLRLGHEERLRGTGDQKSVVIGGHWKGGAPQFRNLRWEP